MAAGNVGIKMWRLLIIGMYSARVWLSVQRNVYSGGSSSTCHHNVRGGA